LLADSGQLSFAMSVSERSMYAHLLVDALLQMTPDKCKQTVKELESIVCNPLMACDIDGHILVLWDGATSDQGTYDEDAARRLMGTLEGLCGVE
jgi:hypothetical protein